GFDPYYGKFFDAGGPGMINQNNSRTDLNWPIYRYAEVLLMFAEAENEANGPTGAAYSAINLVRERAKLPDLPVGLSQDQFRVAVHQERSWELAFESKRVFDLKRWGEFYDTISRHIYGQFAEHLGRGIYDGFWTKSGTGRWHVRDDVIAALRKIQVPNVRWPGGCFADRYHWQDGIGPPEQRPTIVNTMWGNV